MFSIIYLALPPILILNRPRTGLMNALFALSPGGGTPGPRTGPGEISGEADSPPLRTDVTTVKKYESLMEFNPFTASEIIYGCADGLTSFPELYLDMYT